MVKYGVEERVIRPASLSSGDLVTQRQAQDILGVSQQTVLVWVNDGRFAVVWRLGDKPARLLLRAEVEAYAASDRRPGGARLRIAPEVSVEPAPGLDGIEYGIEERVVRPAAEIGDDDVITQGEAGVILGVAPSTLNRRVNCGRFTVVWDLARTNGSGKGSARLLLRSEVEEAAAGGRVVSPVNRRYRPGVWSE